MKTTAAFLTLLALSGSLKLKSSPETSTSNSVKQILKTGDQSGRIRSKGWERRRSQRNSTQSNEPVHLSSDLLSWEPVVGHLQFEKIGNLVPTVKLRPMVINIDLWKIHEQLWKRMENMQRYRGETWRAETNKASQWLRTVTTTLGMKSLKERANRDVLGVLGTVIGLFNFWHGQTQEQLEQRIQKALKTTATRVDALQHWQEQELGTIQRLVERFKKLDNVTQKKEALEGWEELEHRVQALLMVVAGLGRGTLHPAILDLAMLLEALPGFLEHQRRSNLLSLLTNHLDVLACPVSHWTQGYTLRIVVHIPFQQSGHRQAELYLHRQVPLGFRPNLTSWVHSEGRLLAVDKDGFMELQQEDLSRCIHLGNHHLCAHLAAAFTSSKGSCLGALWAEDWTMVRHRCPLISQPALPGAWPTGSKQVAVLLPQPAMLLIQCSDGRSGHETLQGYGLILVPEGCRAVSDEIELLGPGEDEEDKVMAMEVNLTAWNTIAPELNLATNLTISRPEPMTSLTGSIEEILNGKPLFHWTMIIAIALALVAMIVCVTFLLYVYCRFKLAQKLNPAIEAVTEAPNHEYEEPNP